jgi:hypothetical protein
LDLEQIKRRHFDVRSKLQEQGDLKLQGQRKLPKIQCKHMQSNPMQAAAMRRNKSVGPVITDWQLVIPLR